jgi:hypothetical protein
MALLAGAVFSAGSCGSAFARDAGVHTMTVRAPGGGTITVQYAGDVAPQISFGSAPAATASGFESPFATMDRITAQMDREMARMMREADAAMAAMPDANPAYPADLHGAPLFDLPGLFAIAAGGKVAFCMKSVEITSTGDGKPHVVTHQSGNCATGAPAQGHPTVHGTGPRTPV